MDQLKFELMKMHNPIFHDRLSNDELFIFNDNLDTTKELQYLLRAVRELPNLLADPIVGANDLFPRYVQFLLSKRHDQLMQNKSCM